MGVSTELHIASPKKYPSLKFDSPKPTNMKSKHDNNKITNMITNKYVLLSSFSAFFSGTRTFLKKLSHLLTPRKISLADV